MKKKRLTAGALVLAASITACGCGNQVYELTDEERAVVVHYSAHAVTKFNKKQSEGVQDVAAYLYMQELKEEERKRRAEEQKQQEAQQKEEQKKNPQNDKGQAGTGKDNSQGQPEEKANYVPLNEALGISGIDAVYKGYEVVSAYTESESYMINASSGNELLVLHVDLKNSAGSVAKCNILSKMPSFQLAVNSKVKVSADTTILLNDLGTYQGRIEPGDTVKTVLVFQVKKGSAKKVGSMDLEVRVGQKTSMVQLESN